jgi:putative FmdB family regulatory protein
MPVYTYRCRECGLRFTAEQSIKDAPFVRIEHESEDGPCNGEVYRVIGRAAVQYKGHGFHNTDYSRK